MQQDTAVATLQKEWGENFQAKLEAAQRAASRLSPTLLAILDETGLGNNPKIIRFMASLGEAAEQVRDQINAILGDRNHPYHHPTDPRHEKAVKDLGKLYAKAYGTRPIS